MTRSTVAIVSGGMDSITLLYHLMVDGPTDDVHVLSFDYGQRHVKELEFAEHHAAWWGLQHNVIDLSGITHLISNSALTSSPPVPAGVNATTGKVVFTSGIEVPDGHYAEESMKVTVVPNRNMMMLSIAAAVAVNEGAHRVAIGVHAGDHFIYPDCRPEFIQTANDAIVRGNIGFGPFKDADLQDLTAPPEFIYAPFIDKTKTDIARMGNALRVDWTKTWSCYKGGDIHCGTCGTCVERKEALADFNDPTEYRA